jgi:hypothetical protein
MRRPAVGSNAQSNNKSRVPKFDLYAVVRRVVYEGEEVGRAPLPTLRETQSDGRYLIRQAALLERRCSARLNIF